MPFPEKSGMAAIAAPNSSRGSLSKSVLAVSQIPWTPPQRSNAVNRQNTVWSSESKYTPPKLLACTEAQPGEVCDPPAPTSHGAPMKMRPLAKSGVNGAPESAKNVMLAPKAPSRPRLRFVEPLEIGSTPLTRGGGRGSGQVCNAGTVLSRSHTLPGSPTAGSPIARSELDPPGTGSTPTEAPSMEETLRAPGKAP